MESSNDIETSAALTPRWDANGLLPAIAQDADSGEILMLAWMSAESLRLTLEERRAVYFSRSRQALWRKGEESGCVQELVEARIDCDQDAILLRVRQTGPACHTGARSCFYRRIESANVLSRA